MPRENAPLHSDPPVLHWAGEPDPHADGARYISGVPARDLSEHDLARVIYVQTAHLEEGPLTQGKDFEAKRADLIAALVASDLYEIVKAEKPAKPAKPSEAVEAPKE